MLWGKQQNYCLYFYFPNNIFFTTFSVTFESIPYFRYSLHCVFSQNCQDDCMTFMKRAMMSEYDDKFVASPEFHGIAAMIKILDARSHYLPDILLQRDFIYWQCNTVNSVSLQKRTDPNRTISRNSEHDKNIVPYQHIFNFIPDSCIIFPLILVFREIQLCDDFHAMCDNRRRLSYNSDDVIV